MTDTVHTPEAPAAPKTTLDINDIQRILPHRYPFLLVDRVDEIDDDHIAARKQVTRNEPHFEGHFPGHPVMPGVLIIEALAQAGALLAAHGGDFNPETHVVYFMAIDNARFRKPVVPGDMLTQIMMADLPILFGPRADDVFVIGWGSGMTAGVLLDSPVKEVRAVELEPAVIQASHYFQRINHHPWKRNHLELHEDDARHLLLADDRTYDAIVSEPSHPWVTGVSCVWPAEYAPASGSNGASRAITLAPRCSTILRSTASSAIRSQPART